jgi:hypothetical protein
MKKGVFQADPKFSQIEQNPAPARAKEIKGKSLEFLGFSWPN